MKDEIVLITGGSGLIGAKIINELNNCNYNLYFTSRSFKNIKEIENKYKNSKLFVKGIRVDFENDNFLKIFEKFYKTNTPPSAIINNVRNVNNLKVENGVTSINFFQKELNLNVIVPYSLSIYHSNTNYLKKIINISSIYGIVPPNFNLYLDKYNSSPIQYGVSKAALIHLTKELAVRFSEKKILVNAVSYGGVNGRVTSAFEKKYSRLTPINKMLNLDDVATPILFLLTNNYINGHNLIIDGGYTIW